MPDTQPDLTLPDEDSPRFLGIMRQSAMWIHRSEQGVYAVVGLMLVIALVVALVGSAGLLVHGMNNWTDIEALDQIFDRLLFVLMLVEILHTVHASIRAGSLVCEPFLIVGLIACIRRMLVITLETSRITGLDKWNPENASIFQASMIELGVLGVLIVILVGSIRFTRGVRG